MRRPSPGRGGFSLVVMAVLLTMLSIIMVSFLPGRDAGDTNKKTVSSIDKLDKVEAAMRAFMAFKGRRPCPASGAYKPGDQYFGVEAAVSGACTGGTPAAQLGPDAVTGYVVGGTIPTRTLGLPDDYAFDEWGRSFTYVVDRRATIAGSGSGQCSNLQDYPTNDGKGGVYVQIKDTSGAVNSTDQVMYAYISHGPDGHGAFPAQGAGSPANRINTGSLDADQNNNAGVSNDGNFTYSTANFTKTIVKKDRTSAFDDIVYYRDDIKNRCCLGSGGCSIAAGFRADGKTTNGTAGNSIAHGDVNGDGIQDLVIGANGENTVYVILGTTSGLSSPFAISTTNPGGGKQYMDGTRGFKIVAGTDTIGNTVAVGDIDGDGRDDIAMGEAASNGVWVFYGQACGGSTGTACSTSYGDLNGVSNCTAFELYAGGHIGYALAFGDVNGDGYKDLIMSDVQYNTNKGRVYVLFGKVKTCPGAATFPNPMNPDTYANYTLAFPRTLVIDGGTASAGFGLALAAADIDGDGRQDIIIGDPKNSTNQGRVYVVFGQSTSAGGAWQNADDLTNANNLRPNAANTASSGDIANPKGFIIGTGVNNSYFGGSLAAADVTNDGRADIVAGTLNGTHGAGKAYVIPGRLNDNTGWQKSSAGLTPQYGPFVISTMVTNGDAYQFSDAEQLGAWVGVGDFNGDGKQDLLIGDQTFSGNGATSGAAFILFGPISAGNNFDSQQPTGDSGALPGVQVNCPASTNATCGRNLDTLDINGDGTTDAAICSYNANVTGANKEGWCYVLYGAISGWSSTYSLSNIY